MCKLLSETTDADEAHEQHPVAETAVANVFADPASVSLKMIVGRGPGQPNVQTDDMWVTRCFPHLMRLIILIILPCGVSATHPQK